MPYKVEFSPEADQKIDTLPPMVASKLFDAIGRLECDDPYELLEPWFFFFDTSPGTTACRLKTTTA